MSHRLFNSLLKELGDLVFSGGLLDGDAAQLLRVRERLGEWYAALPQAARANGATGDADELDLCARLYMQVQWGLPRLKIVLAILVVMALVHFLSVAESRARF
eukprot:477707-Pleurochrysis_carterae.AAC.5